MEKKKNIYIVASYTDTVPGKLIATRAKLKFWNRYDGDGYSHISLSSTKTLKDMLSFARKEMDNPFNSGLVSEDIGKEMFVLKPEKSKIAVMEIPVTEEQFVDIEKLMEYFWETRDKYNFNFLGLTSMLICGRGLSLEDTYFCSQWVDTVLKECGIDFFNGEKSYNIRPFDFYCQLKKYIIYEGLTKDYPFYNDEEIQKRFI